MNRQMLRDTYPFHHPRTHVACCRMASPKAPRPFPWSTLIKVAAVLAVVAYLARHVQ